MFCRMSQARSRKTCQLLQAPTLRGLAATLEKKPINLFQETTRMRYWWLGGRRRGGLGDYYEFERFSVGLELHFILVERELDRCI